MKEVETLDTQKWGGEDSVRGEKVVARAWNRTFRISEMELFQMGTWSECGPGAVIGSWRDRGVWTGVGD